ncbi:MAG TPA: TIGR03087 family PEP-CTERM/XrtA system glycosyltransferase [Alphaproteobacteria bacterium]|nr:TIGR03087 family PEP-CTERM/XrtA system glycosyltransferase [Alphaproteobacteria bacterium]
MEELLFLAHRIPYPPNKGDKIRAWHILKHLTDRYRVRLGCLVDDPHDRIYIADLERHCAEVKAVSVSPLRQRVRMLTDFRPGQPLSTSYFHSPELASWVDRTIGAHAIRHAFVFSSPMMTYVPPRHGLKTILDLVDVDSEKWRDMAEHAPAPQRWIYAREAETLLAFERRMAGEAEHTLVCSEPEAELFRLRAPEASATTIWMRNGIDFDYFAPDQSGTNPYPDDGRPVIVFTGDMGYWPNIDAVLWFAREVFPEIASRRPRPRLAIVGAHPAGSVLRLASEDVVVTGRVEDIRPYLAHAAVVVAPLQVARGIQNKVLEGMAMARPVVATSAAEQGLGVRDSGAILIADTARDTALRVAEVLDGEHTSLATSARRIIEARFSWNATLGKLDRLLANGTQLAEERVA